MGSQILVQGVAVKDPIIANALQRYRQRRIQRDANQETGIKVPEKTTVTKQEPPRIDLLGSSLRGGDT